MGVFLVIRGKKRAKRTRYDLRRKRGQSGPNCACSQKMAWAFVQRQSYKRTQQTTTVHALLYNGSCPITDCNHFFIGGTLNQCGAMAPPHPLIEPSSFNSSKRDVVLFNPSLAPPSALTPGLTPFPDSTTPRIALASIGKRPWVVSPPPPAIPKNKFGEDISSRGWLSRNASRRGLCATALAFLLVAVLFFVVLGVRKV